MRHWGSVHYLQLKSELYRMWSTAMLHYDWAQSILCCRLNAQKSSRKPATAEEVYSSPSNKNR
jgi:hypothetical protein